jgi:hypothetical protein
MAIDITGSVDKENSPLDNNFLIYLANAEIKGTYYPFSPGGTRDRTITSADYAKKSVRVTGVNMATSVNGSVVMDVVGSAMTTVAYISTDGITHVSSSSANDTRTITVIGSTVSSGVFTHISQTVTLSGQTKVALGTPLARVNEAYANNLAGTPGSVYFIEDSAVTNGVPDDNSKIHLIIPSTKTNSLKASYTTNDGDFLLITDLYASVLGSADSSARVELEIKEPNGVFRQRIVFSAGSRAINNMSISPFLIVPPNSDVRLIAYGSTANLGVVAGFSGLITKKLTHS